MPLDPYSYVAPSRVKTFLCPLGNLKRSTFLNYADRLVNVREVRLVDVTPDRRSDRAMFSPQGYPNGKVVYDFNLSLMDNEYNSLEDLEPWRQTFGVFALTTFSYTTELGDLEEKLKKLRKMYPGPVIHKILVFGVPGKDALVGNKNIIPILSSRISTVTSMGTIMCDITTDFLAELAVLAIARQMGTFKSPAMKELEQPMSSSGRPNHSMSFKPLHSHTGSGSGLASPTGSFTSVHGRLGTSKTGSISLGLSDKSKLRQKGRMLKFLAGMYLIAGRWQDALRDFTEAAITLKSAYDHLWYASALEGIGICLVLLSFLEVPVSIPPIALSSGSSQSHTPDPQNDTLSPTSSHSSHSAGVTASVPPPMFEFLPELTGNILTYFARSQSNSEESVPQIVYCESILRLSNLLAITRLSGGWNPASLNAIVRGYSVVKNITPESPSVSAIASWCGKAYATDLTNMPVLAQANIYCGIAAIYSNIGLIRKRTFILRDLLVNIAPKIMKTRASRAASNGLYSQGITAADKQFISFLDGESKGGVIDLLDSLCSVYGAGNMTSVGYGWGELRVKFLRIALSLCESLLDFVGTVHFAGLLLSTSADVLTNEEQLRISGIILKATESARNLGQGHILASYWDPNLLRDIKMVPTNTSILPQYTNKIGSSSTDVFIHNPYSVKRSSLDPQHGGAPQVSKDDPIMVQNERTEFTVKLQNPFAFEIHIYELSLLTENVNVKAVVSGIYVPPRSMYEVSLPAVPLQVGTLKITGCRIHVAGCEPQDFELISKPAVLQDDKIKRIGVDAGKDNGAEERKAASIRRSLEINVISAQPVMVLKNISLTQSWIMLLEGEKQVFSFTVANISDVEANNVNLKFSDSTTQPLQVALTNKELPLNEIFEVEYFLFHRKALRWKKIEGEKGEVGPHKAKTYEIRILGKRGMTDGIIQVEYANQSSTQQNRPHWSRTLSLPINVTVNSSIELGGCDMIPLQHNQNFTDSVETHNLSCYLENLKAKGVLSDYCLLVIDLRNSWTQSIEATLWSSPHSYSDSINNDDTEFGQDTKDKDRFTVTTLINAGRTARLLLPVKRVEFSLEDLERPIPNLSKRQFILDSNTSPERLRTIRENFWYRDALLKMLGGTWRVIDGVSRSGILELRGIRLSQKMIHVLQVEPVRIKMHATIEQQQDQKSEKDESLPTVPTEAIANSTLFSAQAENDFVTITTTITNNTKNSLSGILRVIPSERYVSAALDPSPHSQQNFQNNSAAQLSSRWENIESKILFNGTLQRPVVCVAAGESVTISMGVLFLSRGEFEWTSIFEELKGTGKLAQHIQRDPIYIKAK